MLKPEIIAAAQSSQRKWGVFTSIALAQYALESGWGKHVSGRHNYFGMKARKADTDFSLCTTHEFIKGRMVEVKCAFRNFPTEEASFDAHGKLLATADCYWQARKAQTYADYAQALTGVYATDPHYGAKLIDIIERSGLAKYDL